MSDTQISCDSGNPIRILVVDADDDTRALYRQSLQQAGCDVVDATDGRAALVKALSQWPTLVVNDTRLPVLDGYALCDVLRRDSTTRAVPILVVTSENRQKEVDRARDAGANGVLIKPVTPETLLREIRRLVRDPTNPRESASAGTPRTMNEGPRRTSFAKAHARFETQTPSSRPPDLVCPECDTPLVYEHSHLGGVSSRHPEQWDAYTCPAACGRFEYRQRTRKLRRIM